MMSQPVMEILFAAVVLGLPISIAVGVVALIGKSLFGGTPRKDSA